ncbi:RNA methyltransferase [Francisella frigiditurris]|uniref:tRNA (cytidine/uridine-2'-O-)-methyltransferase TrmJ n=1 Tax=Francisella frigiditurris TaxID=1542390 RepID=A0A1J0KUG8_9GAMM|nr:RNA methyltransferase [Francisella frigiditurris]APC97327.1 RNA methyltransferase, TrmH, group 1 family protein [Francisella frigiditurris]
MIDKLSFLKNIKIILVEPSHNGNVGSTARAMLNMGLTRLCLVNPKNEVNDEALALASHATDIIKNIEITSTLKDALEDIDYVIGTSARVRRVSLPIEPIEVAAKECVKRIYSKQKVAILFGRERTGLFNEELLMSNIHAYIPTNEGYTSLNLAQAVQLVSYEIYKNYLSSEQQRYVPDYNYLHKKATINESQKFYDFLEESMISSGFLNSENPGYVMDKIKRLFQRSELESQEINILRGFLSSLNSEK